MGVGGDDGDNNGGDCSSDSNRNSLDTPKLICFFILLISMLKISSSTDISTSATKIVVKYNEINSGNSKLIKKLSKS